MPSHSSSSSARFDGVLYFLNFLPSPLPSSDHSNQDTRPHFVHHSNGQRSCFTPPISSPAVLWGPSLVPNFLTHLLVCMAAGSGHVRAAAATAISFLACHPIGAKGDACMTGPHRALLLQEGAMAALLRAALDRTEEASCRRSIERAAAVGVMYLCTLVRPGVACVAP